jgi:homoserine dehydrogenase
MALDDAQKQQPQAARVALLGFGTVGQSVARILTERPPAGVRLTHIFNRRIARKRVDWVAPDVHWTESIDEIFASDANVIVEVIGGRDPAGSWVRRALESGRSVVTANKQLISHEGAALGRLASNVRRHLRFEAAVAGGIPVIGALRSGVSGDRLLRLTGILNGTCNYILTSMASDGVSFADALGRAQELGYAEADPTDDVQGYDARAKLAILCAVGLRTQVAPTDIAARPITLVDRIDFRYAGTLDCTIRQISRAAIDPLLQGRITASVRPSLVPRSSPLARVEGGQNVIVARGEYGGDTVYSGAGAGGGPTAVAVVSDLAAIALLEPERDVAAPPDAATQVDPEFVSAHYLRFIVRDRPGILAGIAQALSRHAINIDAVLQLPNEHKDALPFVVTVEPCLPATLEKAVAEIGAMDFHVVPPVDLPILSNGDAA